MKKRIICALILLSLLLLSSCEAHADRDSTPTSTQTASEKTTPATESIPTPTPIPTPESTPILRSYTTGFPVDEVGEYKPVGVIIENSTAARPQYGLQAADVVYEAPVEGCTRFFCIFSDTLPEKAGPVRSARLYFIKVQQEWDCAFVHFGGPESGKSNVYLASSDHIKTRINFIKGTYNDYYWRTKDKSAPHNAYTDVHKLQEIIEQETKIRTFNYNEEVHYPGQNVSEIVLPFYSGEVTYRYDVEKNKFLRYMGDKAFKDAETQKAVEVQNLIIQYNNFYHGSEAKGRWLCDQLGKGKADFFVGGKHIEGTWERRSFDTPTIYKDSNGDEIVLLPGNTWITVHPESRKIKVTS